MCIQTRSDVNSTGHICRHSLLVYVIWRQTKGHRVTWTPSNTRWMTSRPANSWPCMVKSGKTCFQSVSADGNAYHCAMRRPQYVTSLNWPTGHLQPTRMWPKTTQKQTDHQAEVQSLTGYWALGSRDAWVLPRSCCRSSGGGPLECPWQGCGRQFPAGMPCHGSGSQSIRFWETPHGFTEGDSWCQTSSHCSPNPSSPLSV